MNSKPSFVNTKAFDLLAASPLIVWYGFALAGIALRNAPHLQDPSFRWGWTAILHLASQLATFVFLALQLVWFMLRTLPIDKAQGIAPRLVAVVGANATFAFLALPRVALPLWAEALSVGLVLLGTLGSICAAVNLGRAFSILPQARQFVTSGTYRLVRHPLYLAEQVATWGLMLQFVQPWSALIAIFSLAAQFPRMHYEETVLRRASPAYEYYALKTDRLIPGVY